MNGTILDTTVVRVVDGDTVRVNVDLGEESVRILSLDTEESHAGGSKPVTPLGHAAKAEAMDFFKPGDDIKLEFPGKDPLEVCLQKYRGNFGRLLVHVQHVDRERLLVPQAVLVGRAYADTVAVIGLVVEADGSL